MCFSAAVISWGNHVSLEHTQLSTKGLYMFSVTMKYWSNQGKLDVCDVLFVYFGVINVWLRVEC